VPSGFFCFSQREAAFEMNILAPLSDAGLTKNDIRQLSKEMGLSTWDKPASGCLATRIPYGETIDLLIQQFVEAGVKVQMLKVSHAFHSPLMDPMLAEFNSVAASLEYSQPSISIISNLTGSAASSDIATPDYWVRHVRSSVLFADGITTLLESGKTTFVEIGPRAVLSLLGEMTAASNNLENEGNISWISLMHPKKEDQEQLLTALGELWSLGYPLDISRINSSEGSRRIALPTYPFALDRHWIEAESSSGDLAPQAKKTHSNINDSKEDSQQSHTGETTLDKRVVSNELLGELKRIAGIHAGESDLGLNFFHLGIDSLMLVRIRQFVKKKYQV